MKNEQSGVNTGAMTSAQYRKMAGGKSYQALGRMPAGKMNKTEARYERHLKDLMDAGEVLWYQFSPFNIRLGEKCYYAPDFGVLNKDGVFEVHEIKGGYMTDDSLVKVKVAAEKLPFRFIMFSWVKGKWERREF